MSQTKILLADDHQIVTQGLRMLLNGHEDMHVVHEVRNGQEAIDFVSQCHIDVVVMDYSMPVMNGIEAAKMIKMDHPHVAVIILTSYRDMGVLHKMIDAKVDGCMRKDECAAALGAAIRRVAAGHSYYDSIKDFGLDEPNIDLTERERDVLRESCNGRTKKEIAEVLFISEETIKTHLRNIKSKLGISTNEELIQAAINHGLIS